jgi:hypothetical protein
MTSVFISYRREDAGGHAGRLADRLIARFGGERVFMDVQDIYPGQNFQQAIEQTIARCDHMLAVIGPRWLQILQARAASGEDFVRHEISVALERGMTVIPVLVGGAAMPAGDQLPTALAAFSRCQAVEVRDHHFDGDAARLVDFLSGGPTGRRHLNVFGWWMPRRAAIGSLVALLVVLAGGWFAWSGGAPATVEPAPSVEGDWIAEMQKPGQPPYRIRVTLARSADRVTGMVRYPTGDGPVLEGRVDGNRLTFHTSHVPQFASAPATIRYEAEVQQDAIALTATDEAGTATGVARRAANPTGGAAASRALPSLSYGTWTLRNARDEAGKSWNNSVLQFTSQQESPDGLILSGRFTWRLDNVLLGTEEVAGRYVERTRQVILEGSRVIDAPHEGPERLAVGSYSAVLAADERSLVEGRWGSTAENEAGFAGEWEAVR